MYDAKRASDTVNDVKPKEPRVDKRISCTRDGCQKTFGKKSNMLSHIKEVHEGIKDIQCTHPDCDQMFSRKADMLGHVNAVHKGIKDVACTHPDCHQMFTTKQNMRSHVKAVHEGTKDIECTHPGCDKMFSQKVHMRNHVKTVHEGIKGVECTQPDCDQMFSEKSKMLQHVKAVHEGIKDIPCTHPDCDKMFSLKQSMFQHVKSVHSGIKDIQCTHPGCDQMFSTKHNMKQHYQCWHTKEGQQQKIRKQDRVRKVLESSYAVDSECHIRYESGCIPDPDKFCARVDYHILGITNAIVIVECDEEGHRDYTLTCELSRMEQVHEAIIKANFSNMMETEGEEFALTAPMKPVVFVRFNPDARKVDGEKERLLRADREALLLKVLQDIGDGTLDLPHPLNIVYIGYDMLEGEPVVCRDPDFAPQMRGCVVLAI